MALPQRSRSIAIALTLSSACLVTPALASPACFDDPEALALRFVELAASAPAQAGELLSAQAVKQLGSRLRQILDDRYSPDSARARTLLLGSDWTDARLQTASDETLLSAYLSAWSTSTQVADLRVADHQSSRFLGDEMTVAYRAKQGAEWTDLQMPLSASKQSRCWWLDTPIRTAEGLKSFAERLKMSRTEAATARQGPSRIALSIAAASSTSQADMVEMPRLHESETESTVWVASEPLLTQADVVGALAEWDCNRGLDPEGAGIRLVFADDAAKRLADWSQRHIGQMMAVVMDGRVVTYAKVSGTLSNRLQVCPAKASLDEARDIAARLMGK
ncbi:SecDF P1 head subdomain-containing protein [Ralstonia sp. 24A2]|uniref:SecDF P1 head subdomain-containing protein n=1 Tax=Ralstonia sp. 24A2 TaxID=3447364 RepID=UPI003F69C49B